MNDTPTKQTTDPDPRREMRVQLIKALIEMRSTDMPEDAWKRLKRALERELKKELLSA